MLTFSTVCDRLQGYSNKYVCVYMMCLPKAQECMVLTWLTSFSLQAEMFDRCEVLTLKIVVFFVFLTTSCNSLPRFTHSPSNKNTTVIAERKHVLNNQLVRGGIWKLEREKKGQTLISTARYRA